MAMASAKKSAIPFELVNLEGRRQSLKAGLAHGPVLLGFFKVNCPTCQFAFPFLERIHQHFKERNAQVWGISQNGAQETGQFAQTFGTTFLMLLDEEPYRVSAAYHLQFVPSLFLVAPDGQIEMSGDGFAKQDFLAIHRYLTKYYSATPPPLFSAGERIPEYKPG